MLIIYILLFATAITNIILFYILFSMLGHMHRNTTERLESVMNKTDRISSFDTKFQKVLDQIE